MIVSATPSEALESALYDREWKHFSKRLGHMRWRRRQAGMWAYLDGTWEFELYRGGVPFGRRRTMTGMEAAKLNRNFEDKFAETCLSHPERRLWRWRPVDTAAIKACGREAALRIGS
jgi:hypothetical protein